MPEMTGLEFLREVRKADLHTPCIVISGYDEFSYAREAIRLGATDYLLKPISSTELIRAIIKATDSAHEAKHTDYEELRSSASTLFLHRLLNGELVEIEKVLQACKTLEISLQEGAVTVITLASPNAEEITRALQWAQTRAVSHATRSAWGLVHPRLGDSGRSFGGGYSLTQPPRSASRNRPTCYNLVFSTHLL